MSRVSLRRVLDQSGSLVSDGGIGTELQAAGLPPGGCCESWNLIHPDRVRTIHQSYVDAGAQFLTTNSFGANRFVLSRYDLAARQEEICLTAARLAREAAGEDHWVLGSVGPCGGILEPLGTIRVEDLKVSLHAQIGALLKGGADAILLETLSALDEMELGLQVVRDAGGPFVIASLTYDRVPSGYRTMMGVAPAKAVRIAESCGADMIGANCGTDLAPEEFAAIASEYRAASDLPRLLQPNAGRPDLTDGGIVYPLDPETMSDRLLELCDHAKIVGGCCGTRPAHIDALRRKRTGTR